MTARTVTLRNEVSRPTGAAAAGQRGPRAAADLGAVPEAWGAVFRGLADYGQGVRAVGGAMKAWGRASADMDAANARTEADALRAWGVDDPADLDDARRRRLGAAMRRWSDYY